MIHTEVVNDVVATDEYGVFITCSDDKTIVRYDALKGQVLNVWKGHTRAVTRIVYGPKTKRVYSAGRDCHVYAWDTAYTKPLVKFEGHEFAVQVRNHYFMCWSDVDSFPRILSLSYVPWLRDILFIFESMSRVLSAS